MTPPRYATAVALACRTLGLPMPEPEVRFCPPRRFRFDWAWVEEKVALEIQGGIFTHGRHTRGAALLAEHEKLNLAASLGYRVFYATPKSAGNLALYRLIQAAREER